MGLAACLCTAGIFTRAESALIVSLRLFCGLIEFVKHAARFGVTDSWPDAGVRPSADDLVVSRVSGCGAVFVASYCFGRVAPGARSRVMVRGWGSVLRAPRVVYMASRPR